MPASVAGGTHPELAKVNRPEDLQTIRQLARGVSHEHGVSPPGTRGRADPVRRDRRPPDLPAALLRAPARPVRVRPQARARPALGPGQRFERARSEYLLAFGARADKRHRHLQLALDELDIAPRIGRQRAELGDLVERLLPAGQGFVDRLAVVEIALV